MKCTLVISIIIHIILFLALNYIPHGVIYPVIFKLPENTISSKHINRKRKTAIVEVINMVQPVTKNDAGKNFINLALKDAPKYEIERKQIVETKQFFKEITAFNKPKEITVHKGSYPRILMVTHNATRTLGKNEELVVTLNGDSGELASFDIGFFRTEIPMNEISPGVYRGIYRVIEGDNIVNAAVVGYLVNKDSKQVSQQALTTVTINTSPGVTIATPQRESIVDKAVQTVTGVVDDFEVKNLVLSLNSDIRNVPVENGCFNSEIKLVEGKNVIEVMIVNSKGDIGRDHIEITYAPYKAGAKISIIYPLDGDIVNVTETPVMEIYGTIADMSVKTATLIVNDLPMEIAVKDGEFRQKVVILSEINSYVIQATNQEGAKSVSVPITVKATGLGYYDAIVTLTTDTPRASLDLIVKNPGGKFISHKAQSSAQNPNAIPGGKMELIANEGFGPEVITLRQVSADLYSVHVNYFESNGSKPINALVNILLIDPHNQKKIISRLYGPNPMNVGDEWKVTFIGIPEMKFYAAE